VFYSTCINAIKGEEKYRTTGSVLILSDLPRLIVTPGYYINGTDAVNAPPIVIGPIANLVNLPIAKIILS